MSFLLTCKILIDNKYSFNFANSIEIVSTWQTLGDTCTLLLPSKGVLITEGANINTQTEFSFEQRFKVGMSVKVWIGYDNENELKFSGFIREIKPKNPFELICEDAVFNLKRSEPISTNFEGTLKSLLSFVAPTAIISDSIPDVQISNFIINKATPAEVLGKLKESYGLCAYYRGDVLFVGLPYTEFNSVEPVEYTFQEDVHIDSDNLTYKRIEDIKIKVKAISFQKDNSKIEIEVGDANGELRTLHTSGETDKSKLEAWAKSQLDRLKYEGYSGSFDVFGLKTVEHSASVSIVDERYKERSGQIYVVDKVTTNWGVNGFKQNIEIGKKL